MSSGGTRVSICEIFETSPTVGVWTTGACWPTCGAVYWPTGWGEGSRLYS